MNTIQLIGRIGHDLELKNDKNGNPYIKLSLALNSYGEGNDEVDWIPLLAFGKCATNIHRYCKKGNRLAIQGHLQSRKMETEHGDAIRRVYGVVERFTFIDYNEEPVDPDETDPSYQNTMEEVSNTFLTDETLPF